MKILAVVPFTGSKKLVEMTRDCIKQFRECDVPEGVSLHFIAVNNAASESLNLPLELVEEFHCEKNYGFGVGVNRAIDYWLIAERRPCTHVLVLNNDLQFPHRDWLTHLLREVDPEFSMQVLTPCTDITATPEAKDDGPRDIKPLRCGQVSAFCWLVPVRVIQAIDARFDFPLFHPMFTNYGSDDATAAILRKLYGPTPFKVVPRSFVKHLKAQTANELGVKAGTKELLSNLKQWK